MSSASTTTDAALFRSLELHVARLIEACAKDEVWHTTHHRNLHAIATAINTLALPIDPSIRVVLQEPSGQAAAALPYPMAAISKTLHTIVECATPDLLNDKGLHDALRSVRDTQQFNELKEASFEALLPLLKQWVSGGSTPGDCVVGFTLMYEGARAFPAVFGRKQNRRLLREVHAALLNLVEDGGVVGGPSIETIHGLANHISEMGRL